MTIIMNEFSNREIFFFVIAKALVVLFLRFKTIALKEKCTTFHENSATKIKEHCDISS